MKKNTGIHMTRFNLVLVFLLLILPASALANEDVDSISIYYLDQDPYYLRDDTGVMRGIIFTKINAAFDRMGVQALWITAPARRLLRMFETTTAPACAVGFLKTREREAFGTYSVKVHRGEDWVVVSRLGSMVSEDFYDIKQLLEANQEAVLGVIEGTTFGPDLDLYFQSIEVRSFELPMSVEHLLNLLANNRFDYTILPREEFEAHFAGQDLQPQLVVHEFPLSHHNVDVYIFCKFPIPSVFVDRFNDALDTS